MSLPWNRSLAESRVVELIESTPVPTEPNLECETITVNAPSLSSTPITVNDSSSVQVFTVKENGDVTGNSFLQKDTDAGIYSDGTVSAIDLDLPSFPSVSTTLTSQASAIATNTANIASNTSAIATASANITALQTKTQHLSDNGSTTTLSAANTIISGDLQVTGTTTTINTVTTQANNMILTYTGVASTPALQITQTGGSGNIVSVTDADGGEIFAISQGADLNINNKVTVDATSGDTAVGGTLNVTGQTTLTGGLSTPLTVANGGTGAASTTAYAVLCGGTTSTSSLQSVSGVGTSGQVLTSNGASALPTWQAPAGGFTVSFRAYLNSTATNVTGDGTVYIPVMNTTSPAGTGWNNGGGYNTSTGIFTCPAGQSGYYQFAAELIVLGLTSSHTGLYVTPGGTYSYGNNTLSMNPWACCVSAGATITVNPVSTLVYLAAGETFRFALQVQGGSKVVGLSSSSVFSGYRVQ
jgi:hypothetical protein